ncbi:hypothetical protein L535_2725 [Bordetella bronchiseptica SBL-F6116]|nr:hypothetical protein L489_2937 [Bordetella bronchiseptica 00-P-2730]KDE01421.1 hypothetical protein L535_2725 [Bordetella bronchiseptica SBL-F6116]
MGQRHALPVAGRAARRHEIWRSGRRPRAALIASTLEWTCSLR